MNRKKISKDFVKISKVKKVTNLIKILLILLRIII